MRTPAKFAVVVSAGLVLSGLTPVAAYATTRSDGSITAQAVETVATQPARYYLTKYDGTIWEVTDEWIVPLTFEEWQAEGFPAYQPAPTDYVRYPWGGIINAVTFFGPNREDWVWKQITGDEWARVGRPKPRDAGWIETSDFYKWSTSSQIFVDDGAITHALTAKEWADSGWAEFETFENEGFVRLSWDSTIAFLENVSGGNGGGPITFLQWANEGYPTPYVAARFPGDQLYRNQGSATVYYAGPTVHRAITFAEWTVMGQPAPEVR